MTLFLFYVINIFKVKQSYDLMIGLGYIGDINREREREKRKGLFSSSCSRDTKQLQKM
jgi:hypothetical protein